MADSSLVTYELYSPHFGYPQGSHGRDGGVGCVCVHHMAGNLSVQTCGNVFQTREASAHYGINGTQVGQYVRESDCPWAAGNKAANNYCYHIECANDGGADSNWHVSDQTIETCINLIVDICKRHGWKTFRFTGDDNTGELTAHKWYASTACPGPYLYSKFPYIAEQVQKKLDGEVQKLYRVRKTWEDSKSQIGAFKSLENAKKKADANAGYKVFDWDGNVVYEPAAKTEEKVEVKTEEKKTETKKSTNKKTSKVDVYVPPVDTKEAKGAIAKLKKLLGIKG